MAVCIKTITCCKYDTTVPSPSLSPSPSSEIQYIDRHTIDANHSKI